MTPLPLILVVDDKELDRTVVVDALCAAGYKVAECDSVESAIAVLNDDSVRPSVAILDLLLQYELERTWFLLDRLKQRYPLMPILILTAHGSTDLAVKTMKSGATDFIEKPLRVHFTVDTVSSLIIPKVRAALIEAQRFDRSELRLLLAALSEDQLIDLVLLPLLRMQGFMNVQRASCHGPGEVGRDILPSSRQVVSGRESTMQPKSRQVR